MENINKKFLITIALCFIMVLYILNSLFWQKSSNQEKAELEKKRVIIDFKQIKQDYHEE